MTRRPPAFHWRTLRETVGEAGGMEGQPGVRDSGEGEKREDTEGVDGG